MSARQPTVDLVQVFCANFDSHRDYSGPERRRREVEWPRIEGVSHADLAEAKISRYTLEIFNLVLSGEGDHLIPDVLAYYVALPVDRIASTRAIAKVLIGSRPPLVEGSLAEVEERIGSDLDMWRTRAGRVLEIRRVQ